MNTSDRPKKWIENKRYLGAILADDSISEVRTFRSCSKLKSVPHRPEKYHSIINRILQAWDVLVGNADALYWYEYFDSKVRGGKVIDCECGECF